MMTRRRADRGFGQLRRVTVRMGIQHEQPIGERARGSSTMPVRHPMRVLIISHFHDPEPIPKTAELAAGLKQRGHEVRVITGFPNYPSGELYPGYRLRLIAKDEVNGVEVTRTYQYPYHGASALRRLVNYWSFAFSAPLAVLFRKRPDVIYAWHPPLTIGVAAAVISFITRAPIVYDVQDIWPESALVSGMLREGFIVNLMRRLEKWVYRRAAHVLVVTEGAKRNLLAKGVPESKLTVIPNWIDETMFKTPAPGSCESVRASHGWGADFVVLFAGNIGLVQGLDTVVRAAALLPEGGIRFVIVGDGADRARLIQLAEELKTGARLQFIDRQPMSAMPSLMAAADALLVHLRRSELADYVIPTKTLAYLAAGKPIVMAMEGAAAQLVAEADAGVVLPPDQPETLADAVERLSHLPASELARLGVNGEEHLRRTMTRARLLPEYEAILERTMLSRAR